MFRPCLVLSPCPSRCHGHKITHLCPSLCLLAWRPTDQTTSRVKAASAAAHDFRRAHCAWLVCSLRIGAPTCTTTSKSARAKIHASRSCKQVRLPQCCLLPRVERILCLGQLVDKAERSKGQHYVPSEHSSAIATWLSYCFNFARTLDATSKAFCRRSTSFYASATMVTKDSLPSSWISPLPLWSVVEARLAPRSGTPCPASTFSEDDHDLRGPFGKATRGDSCERVAKRWATSFESSFSSSRDNACLQVVSQLRYALSG